MLLACVKAELPQQMAFRVIEADGHQTGRVETNTLSAADLGEIEQRGCDHKHSWKAKAPERAGWQLEQNRGFAVLQIRSESKPSLGLCCWRGPWGRGEGA